MKNHLRLFIAFNVSSIVKLQISKLIRSFREQIPGTKWVEPSDIHITLKFLGDVSLNDLPALISALGRSAKSCEPFDIEFRGCGAFPNLHNPKTIWVACSDGQGEMSKLATKIDSELFSLGYPKETRKFSPHVTIGRIKKVPDFSPSLHLFESYKQKKFGHTEVDELILYSSELTRKGPIYDEIAAVPLG